MANGFFKETYSERAYRLSLESRELTKNCREHKCPYLKRFSGGYSKSSHDKYLNYYCGYLDITGHARIKEPENADSSKCTHWKDTVDDTKTNLILNPF